MIKSEKKVLQAKQELLQNKMMVAVIFDICFIFVGSKVIQSSYGTSQKGS
jgi:hypothetical protein